MRSVRRVVQILSLGVFVGLILLTVKPLQRSVPTEIFLRLDPLLAIAAMLAARSFIWLMLVAGVTLVVTALLGRVFCGWVCPLGTTLDIFNRVFLRKRRFSPGPAWAAKIKYVLLVVLIVLAAMGFQAAGWFDPISLATRTYGMVLYPLADRAIDIVTAPFDSLHARFQETPYFLRQAPNVFALTFFNAFVFVTVLGLESAQRRSWCRNLCPLGALLALAGRWNILPVRVRKGCRECGKCSRACPTGAIEKCKVSPLECVQCFTCTAKHACPDDAMKHAFGPPLMRSREETFPVAPSRRAFIFSALGALASAPLLWKEFTEHERGAPVVRPPGGQDEARLLGLCVRCGECMKVCPNNAIHPCFMEAGLAGFMTPRIVPRVGYCEFDCAGSEGMINNLCGKVCPTGALERLDKEAKQSRRVGTACVNRSKCIPWTSSRNCGMCADACPVDAIGLLEEGQDETGEALMRPFVLAEACIGCGKCEYVCPVKGAAAVRVDRLQA